VDGRTIQERQFVAKKKLSAELEIGGLGIPHPDETIKGFQQNLFKIFLSKADYSPRLFSVPYWLVS
jgi:hypothetical protein